MTRWLTTLGAIGALLLPTGALGAALCDLGAGGATNAAVGYQGRVAEVAAICLCDGTADCVPGTGTGAANDYDLRAMSASLTKSPDLLIFERNLVTDCAADLTATFATGPDADTLHTLGSTTAINAATSRLVVDLQRAPVDRFLNVSLTNTAGCTDSEIILIYGEIER